MTSWVFSLSEVIGDTSKYLVYTVNDGWRNVKSRRSYVIFGDVYYEIEFTEACSGKLVLSLSRSVILRIKFEDVKKTYWWWHG